MSLQDPHGHGETRHLENTPSAVFLSARGTAPLNLALPWVLEFRVVGTASTIQLQLRDAMVLGRKDPERDVNPEVDLTPHQALAKGVSRKHAVVLVKEGRVSVKDLNSTNGTRLNDLDLLPEKEYRLRHGDELTLGQLRLQVRFMVVPAHETGTWGLKAGAPAEKKTDAAPSNGTSSTHTASVDIPTVGGGRRALVIEDDSDVGNVFRMALEHAGFSVTVMKSTGLAMDDVLTKQPDVIVLDLMMPDLSELNLVRYVRKHESSKHIPILVISGVTGGYQMGKAMEAGADVFLGKPVSIEELVKAVGTTLK